MTDLSGQRVGPYQLDERIGAGAASGAYRVRRADSGRAVALTLIDDALAAAPGFAARFGRVASASAALRHPHVAPLEDYGEGDGRFYLAFELPPDGSLADLLRQGAPLPADVVADLGRQAAEGLAYAHARGVLHGDVRPANLLLAREAGPLDFSLKVGGFGLAALAEGDGQTATGTQVADPAYMSPEQFQGLEADGRSDIYALGVVLYQAAVGALPFNVDTLSAAVAGHVFEQPRPPRELRPELPAALEAIILRCLAKQPDERFASAADLAGALGALAQPVAQSTYIPPSAAAPPSLDIADVPLIALAPAAAPDALLAPDVTLAPDAPAAEAPIAATPPPDATLAPPPIPPDATFVAAASPPDATLAPDVTLAPDATAAAAPVAATPPPDATLAPDATAADATFVAAAPPPDVTLAPPPIPLDATFVPSAIAPPDALYAPTVATPAASGVPATEAAQPATPLAAGAPIQVTPTFGTNTTQTVVVGTPVPGFPTLPPLKPVPQVQLLDAQGESLQTVDLTGDGLAIGRLASNDLVLDAEGVSELHAQIDWNGSRVSVLDLGSKNGTLMGRVRIRPEITVWEPSAPLQIGPFWLRLIPALASMASMIAPSAVAPAGVPLPASMFAPALSPPPSINRMSGEPGVVAPSPVPVSPYPGQLIPTPTGAAPYNQGMSAAGGGGITQPVLNTARISVLLDEEAITLTPGQTSTVRMMLTNQGATVDHFTVTIGGVPANWVQGSSPKVQLLPGTPSPVALAVNAPRTPESRAGVRTVTVNARSTQNANEYGEAPQQWTVLPFNVNTLDLRPKRAAGWRRGRYTVTLTNGGNQPMSYKLGGEDDEQALDFDFPQDQVALEPGATARQRLVVRGPWRWFGSSQARGFTVQSRSERKGDAQLAAGQFSQRALIPVWLLPLLLLAAVGLFFLIRLPPKIESFGARPAPQQYGTPVMMRWQASNAQRALLHSDQQGLDITVSPVGSYTFAASTVVPPDLKLIAYSRFGVTAEAEANVTSIPSPTNTSTATPTNTPTNTPTEKPTDVPPSPTAPLPTVAIPTSGVQITSAPLPTATTASTAPITGTVTIAGAVECRPGVTIEITGSGFPRQGYLLYFGTRPVGGGVIGPDGRFSIRLRIGAEPGGTYPVSVRLRDSLTPLNISVYTVTDDSLAPTPVSSAQMTGTELTCKVPPSVPLVTLTPTPPDGVPLKPLR